MSILQKLSPKSFKKLIVILSLVFIAILFFLCWLWTTYGGLGAPYECTNFAMGSFVQQTVYGKNGEAAATAAAREIGELEDRISWRIEGSDIQKLNEQAGIDWIELEPETISLLSDCLTLAQQSDGAFDPTILPISALWDFGGENEHLPEKDQIEQFLPFVNYKDLRINEEENTASLKYHYMGVDLGGVGKGAACDSAIAAYKQAGADCGIVSVGGSVGVYGTKPDGSLWGIAVRDPESGEDKTASMGILRISSGFVSTSGIYERTFEQDGVSYHHLLNPKTGYPENNDLFSVTVVCENGAMSDGLATACFLLGIEKGMDLLKNYDAEGIFLTKDHEVVLTDGLIGSFEITSEQYTFSTKGDTT